MILKHIRIRNFLIHEDTELSLGDVSVLVGANGTGKSAIIDALFVVGRLARGPVERSFDSRGPFAFAARKRHGAPDDEPMAFALKFANDAYSAEATYEVELGLRDERVVVLSESLKSGGAPVYVRDQPQSETLLSQARRGDVAGLEQGPANFARQCARALGRILRYRLEPYQMQSDASEIEVVDAEEGDRPPPPYLGPRGENLAGLLYWFDQWEPNQMGSLTTTLLPLIPGFERIVFSTAVPGRVGWGIEFSDSRETVSAGNLSSGTLSIVGLVALVTFRGRTRNPVLICVEEPELGLTPSNALALYNELAALASSDMAQVLISTHSPHIAHCQLMTDDQTVFRLRPHGGIGAAEAFRASIVEQGGPEEWQNVVQGGGMGVNAVLRSMEEF
jgi:predicted ATPase